MRLILVIISVVLTSQIYSLTLHRDIGMMNTMLKDIPLIMSEGHSPQRTLIVFDIDHTLINLLSGEKLKASGLTERKVPLMIKNFQDANFPIITLTARPNIFHKFTKRQLNKYSVDFNRNKIGSDWVKSRRINGFKRVVSYKDGIMMAWGQHKGRLLEYLIRSEYNGKIPFSQIIFVDDSIRNTTGVYKVFTNLGIEIAAYRYKGRKKRRSKK